MIANGFVRLTRSTVGSLSRRLCMLLLAAFAWGVGAVAYAQIQMPMPAQTSTFSSNARGYWFTAPTNFVIVGVEVPTDASSGTQNIAVLRFLPTPPATTPDPPPIFSATTNNFDALFLTQNNATAGTITTKIPVTTGDIMGVLGNRGNTSSYGNGSFGTTIDGIAIPLTRLGMQFPLATTAPQQVWQEPNSTNISRVWLYYQPGFLISGEASPPAGGTVTCSPDIIASGATTTCTVTPSPGYAVSEVSGCGVTATAPPYDTAPASAHCTVTATFIEGVTVGGTVSGLSGSGLALSLNGTETLPIAADGSFTFTSTVITGDSYNVTVQTQPTTPSQTCVVTNGSGTAGASNITDVAVACTTNTYTVGGNVSGLTGSGLVLSLNSGVQTLPVAADGSFTFPTAILSGGAYTVTVQTQPSTPTQTCTVGTGSGTVTNANVTDVAITCTTNTYTVGGSVSGLAGSGLVLFLNGGAQTLPVAADGGFTFPTAIASGSAYTVSVQTQPSAPTQTCTVGSGVGTVTNANVTNVSVNCGTNTYTVGGSVSGLMGSGLVLSLNGGAQTFNVSSSGSFVFPTALASGAPYSVTVQTQPSSPAQTCTVGSGSGTVTTANVSDVAITCSTNTYAVGGSVSGLTGSGLVLSLSSGAQTLPIGADGSFTFPTAVASGSAYTVSVQTQPSSPAQFCSVTSGTGTVASSNVTNVAVLCAAQQRTVSLSSTFGNVTATPPIPSNVADGTVLVFALNVPAGYTLLGASGCGGSLSGTTYTTAPITSNCAISVAVAGATVAQVPTLDRMSLALLPLLLMGLAAFARRRLR